MMASGTEDRKALLERWFVVKVEMVDSADAIGPMAAGEVLDELAATPDLVLGVATGSTPLPVYRYLAAVRADGTDFSGVRLLALDEYIGLPPGHPASYGEYVRSQIAEPLGVAPERVVVPSGSGDELEQQIRALGAVDVQLLGIGRNGHLAFNEPPSAIDSRSRIVELSHTTRHDNAHHFGPGESVPTHALTQGLGTILEARHLVLLGVGEAKADAVAAALCGPVTPACPASVVQLHPKVTVILDRAAARLVATRWPGRIRRVLRRIGSGTRR
jgi:glucosamine-6-phosphate deaminase